MQASLVQKKQQDYQTSALIRVLAEYTLFLKSILNAKHIQTNKKKKQSTISKEKHDIINWIRQLTPTQRASLLCINDSGFVKTLLSMAMANKKLRKRQLYESNCLPEYQLEPLPTFKQTKHKNTLETSYNKFRNNGNHVRNNAQNIDKDTIKQRPSQIRTFLRRPILRTMDGDIYRGFQTREYRDACIQLTENIYIVNTFKSCDTLTLRMSYYEEVHKFISLCESISKGQFLEMCPTQENLQTLIWGEVPWLAKEGYYTFEALIINQIEMNIWVSWRTRNMAPSSFQLPVLGLAAKNHLTREWQSANRTQRLEINRILLKYALLYIREMKPSPMASHHHWQSALEGMAEVLALPSNMKTCQNKDSSEGYFGVEFELALNATRYSALQLLIAEYLQEQCSKLLCLRLASDSILSTTSHEIPKQENNAEQSLDTNTTQTNTQKRRALRKKNLKQRKRDSQARLQHKLLLQDTLLELSRVFRKRKKHQSTPAVPAQGCDETYLDASIQRHQETPKISCRSRKVVKKKKRKLQVSERGTAEERGNRDFKNNGNSSQLTCVGTKHPTKIPSRDVAPNSQLHEGPSNLTQHQIKEIVSSNNTSTSQNLHQIVENSSEVESIESPHPHLNNVEWRATLLTSTIDEEDSDNSLRKSTTSDLHETSTFDIPISSKSSQSSLQSSSVLNPETNSFLTTNHDLRGSNESVKAKDVVCADPDQELITMQHSNSNFGWGLPSIFSAQSSIHTASTVSGSDWDFFGWNKNIGLNSYNTSKNVGADCQDVQYENDMGHISWNIENNGGIEKIKEDRSKRVLDTSVTTVQLTALKDHSKGGSDFLYRPGGFFDRQRELKESRRPLSFAGISSPTNTQKKYENDFVWKYNVKEETSIHTMEALTRQVEELKSISQKQSELIEKLSAQLAQEISAREDTMSTIASQLSKMASEVEESKKKENLMMQDKSANAEKNDFATPLTVNDGHLKLEVESTTSLNQEKVNVHTEQTTAAPQLPAQTYTNSNPEANIINATSTSSSIGPFVSVPMSFLPPRSRLHWDMCEFVSQIQSESNARFSAHVEAHRLCTATVQSLWPRAQVRPYGSFVTGLALPSSDLDLVICLPQVHRSELADGAGVLEGRNAIKETWQQNLARRLRQEPWVVPDSVKTIPQAAIPIINLVTVSPYDIRLDISFEGPGHNGLATNDVVLNLINEFPPLAPMMLVLKSFVIERGFASAYSGGLSSYALLLMVARYLQEHSDCANATPEFENVSVAVQNSISAQSSADFGVYLMGFLDFYGNRFDPRITGISVASRCFLNREREALGLHHTSGPITQSGNEAGERYSHWQKPQQSPIQNSNFLSSPGSRRYENRKNMTNNSTFSTQSVNESISRLADDSGGVVAAQNLPLPTTQGYDRHKFDPVFIEDPLLPTNNVGRNCFRIIQIRRAFSSGHSALMAATMNTFSPIIVNWNCSPLVVGVPLNPDNTLRTILGVTTGAHNKTPGVAINNSVGSITGGGERSNEYIMNSNNYYYSGEVNPYQHHSHPPYYQQPHLFNQQYHYQPLYSQQVSHVTYSAQTQQTPPCPPSSSAPSSGVQPSSTNQNSCSSPKAGVYRRHSECESEKIDDHHHSNRIEQLVSPRRVTNHRNSNATTSDGNDTLAHKLTFTARKPKSASRSMSFADVVVRGSGSSSITNRALPASAENSESESKTIRYTYRRLPDQEKSIHQRNTKLETRDDFNIK